ncbi:MAG: hypothetical protein JEY91_03760 [Spirochaetaceae bacterium]|nr:hypothetical protein [Spirochaetaceae bacterium]
MYREFTGLDEAALGPVLGPYCCALVSFHIQNDRELFDRFSSFKDVKIGDSKKLYTSGKSIGELENTALSFTSLYTGRVPETLFELLEELIMDKRYLKDITAIPWYTDLSQLKLPIACERAAISKNSTSLNHFMSEQEIELDRVVLDAVPAKRFNQLLSKGLNKSQVCQEIISPLLSGNFNSGSRITVDRQGGRRYYGEWLVDIFPKKPLSIIQETQDLSSYSVDSSTIRFQVKGDDKYLETALASIFSKYTRELMMICFNNYWSKRVPGIRKTAGYPQDGKRFIRDLESRNIDFDRQILIRVR